MISELYHRENFHRDILRVLLDSTSQHKERDKYRDEKASAHIDALWLQEMNGVEDYAITSGRVKGVYFPHAARGFD